MILNTLFVTRHGASLKKEGETILVCREGRTEAKVPFVSIASVACFGGVWVSPVLAGALAECSIPISFFSQSGRFRARFEGVPGGSVLLRQAQFAAAAVPTTSLGFARSFVLGKIANAKSCLLRWRRDTGDEGRAATLGRSAGMLTGALRNAASAGDIDGLRGDEGWAARAHFEGIGAAIHSDDPRFAFSGRSRRPPKDRVNCLLSFGYTLLMHDCVSALCGVGLDPAMGFLHGVRPGRMSLALDLMEEFRPHVVDRRVVTMINRAELRPADFEERECGETRLSDDARRKFIVRYQEAKAKTLTHPFLDRKMEWGLVPHVQARLLARTLRGDLDAYPPFIPR
jgi:CRISP-associated protein Cas1